MSENRDSLLVRFVGLYKMFIRGKAVPFVVMNNVLPKSVNYSEVYDLKGSTVGRAATEQEKQKEFCILKDLDIIENNRKLSLGERRKQFLEQLQKDCNVSVISQMFNLLN